MQLAVGAVLMLLTWCAVSVSGYRIGRSDQIGSKAWRQGAWIFASAILVWTITVWRGSPDRAVIENFCISLLAIAFAVLTIVLPSALVRRVGVQ